MVNRDLDAEASDALAGLDLAQPFTLCDLVLALEHARSTSIKIMEFPEIAPEDGLLGLWLNTKFGDYIMHVPTASQLHRQQIILHELAHMILGHDLAAGTSSSAALFPDIHADTVVHTLSRGHNDNDMEREAEALADLIASSMRRHRQISAFERVFG